MIGSCFTENMGEKLAKHLFHVLENPNGVLFNPVSVAEALTQYYALQYMCMHGIGLFFVLFGIWITSR